ncbi:MAG: HD-GYP domain-containing protein, partial [Planctomycetaceae bacterium]
FVRLWQVDRELLVVFCSAYSDYSAGEIFERLGRNDRLLILKKPFDSIEVEQLAAALSEKRQLLRERARYTRRLEDRVREQTAAIQLAHEETIHRLVAASMFRDKETGEHIRRVGLMSAILARAAGRTAAEVDRIRLAAPMHDVGKIGIPDVILQKPSCLTPEERQVMERHTVIGAHLLSGSHSPMLQMAREIALYHHEQWNGTGYPIGLAKRDIPFEARVVAVVDVFDALTHDRVYRPAFSIPVALNSLNDGSGHQFDPELVELFFENIGEISAVVREHRDAPVSPLSLVGHNSGQNEVQACLAQMTPSAGC